MPFTVNKNKDKGGPDAGDGGRARIMLDATPLTCQLWNKNFEIFDCNEESVRLFGVKDKREYIDRFWELSPELQPDGRRSRDKAVEVLKRAFMEERYVFDWMHQKADGAPLPMEVTLTRVQYQNETVIAAYARDLSEVKTLMGQINDETEKFMRKAHWYESILDAVPFGITVQDVDKKFTFVNATAEETFGKKRDDLLGKPCDTLGLNICGTKDCAIVCAVSGKTRTYFTHNDMSYQADVKILKDLNGHDTGYIEVIQDITKMEHMARQQAKAVAASKAKGDFLSNMSHEMRTPMNAIIGMTAIGKKAEDIERKNHALNKIGDASSHLLGVINDVLDIAKIEANKLELAPVEYHFERMLQSVLTVINFRADEKKQNLTVRVDPKIPRFIVGDDQRLAQVVTNVLANAVKFTPDGGSIHLDARLAGESRGLPGEECELRIEVTDDGIGISPDKQGRLFRAFEQAESGTSRQYGGTGLGLVISKNIVELMGGSIRVDSELGKGARFTFTVKALRGSKRAHSEDAGDDGAVPVTGEFAGKTLLVAEDIEINREILIALLEDTGITIECAENGIEALRMVESHPDKYDIVFMDVQMPKMDGFEATRRIRATPDRARGRLPVIAMTANVFTSDVEDCLAAGMDGHLGKPLDLDKVLETLREYLGTEKPE